MIPFFKNAIFSVLTVFLTSIAGMGQGDLRTVSIEGSLREKPYFFLIDQNEIKEPEEGKSKLCIYRGRGGSIFGRTNLFLDGEYIGCLGSHWWMNDLKYILIEVEPGQHQLESMMTHDPVESYGAWEKYEPPKIMREYSKLLFNCQANQITFVWDSKHGSIVRDPNKARQQLIDCNRLLNKFELLDKLDKDSFIADSIFHNVDFINYLKQTDFIKDALIKKLKIHPMILRNLEKSKNRFVDSLEYNVCSFSKGDIIIASVLDYFIHLHIAIDYRLIEIIYQYDEGFEEKYSSFKELHNNFVLAYCYLLYHYLDNTTDKKQSVKDLKTPTQALLEYEYHFKDLYDHYSDPNYINMTPFKSKEIMYKLNRCLLVFPGICN